MKNIIKSIIIIISISFIAGGSTVIALQDKEMTPRNTISTAMVDIDLKSRLDSPITANDLVPGKYTEWSTVNIFNISDDVPVRIYMYVDNLKGLACNKTNLVLASEIGSEEEKIFFENSLNEIKGESKKILIANYKESWDPDSFYSISQRAQLDLEADNSFQDSFCTWDEIFIAESVNNN